MNDLGNHFSEGVAVAPGGDPHFTQFGAYSDLFRVTLNFPTLDVPAISSALLGAAQESAKNIPAKEIAGSLLRYIEGSLSRPVDAAGLRLIEDEGLLLVNLGFGLLTLKLTDAALDELKNICRDIR